MCVFWGRVIVFVLFFVVVCVYKFKVCKLCVQLNQIKTHTHKIKVEKKTQRKRKNIKKEKEKKEKKKQLAKILV